MTAAPNGTASRNPSGGSSTQSLKGLNGSWQVWGSGAASSKRTASISSSASVPDPALPDPAYRSSMGDATWAPAIAVAAWDMAASPGANAEWGVEMSSPKKKDTAQDTHSPSHSFNLQQARQRQATAAHASALSAPRLVGLGASDDDQRPPVVRFEKEPSTPGRFPAPGSSPSKATGYGSANAFASPGSAHPNGSNASPADAELTIGLRNMALEDEYSATPAYRGGPAASGLPAPAPVIPQIRAPPPLQGPPRSPYTGYLQQPDYAPYYNVPSARESFGDYPFGFDAFRSTPDPSLYGSPPIHSPPPASLYPTPQALLPHPHDMHRNPNGVFYDYSAQSRPLPSQYYFQSPPPMVYHRPPAPHSPMQNGPIGLAPPLSLGDKARELQNMQFTLQHQQQLSHQQNLILAASIRSSPSPLPFPGTVDYTQQFHGPLIAPGTPVYGHSAAPTPPMSLHLFHHHGIRSRRSDLESGALRSQLLDEFRSNKSRKWELRDITGHVVEFSGDQHGSRFIQQKLELATSDEKQVIFDEILPGSALQLIQDVFGNYVIQKLFEYGNQAQKTLLANAMEGYILQLSLNMYGCRVVQKAVEYILPDQHLSFVQELDAHVLRCVKDANGNHVIQKLIERVNPERLGFVSAFRGNVYELSTHPYGCRVLQRCIEYLTEEQTRPLLDELHRYTANLMQDQFGNYVVQFVLDKGKPEDRMLIVSKLRGQMLQMAKHKFASNVCEKALVTADTENRRLLIEEMMAPKHDGINPIATMMKDQYANYVLQRALVVVEGEQKEALIGMVRAQIPIMRRYSSTYSKHLLAIERLIDRASATVNGIEHDDLVRVQLR